MCQKVDITQRAALDAAVAATLERYGQLDVVLVNAGVVTVGSVERGDPQAFERVIMVNLIGAWQTVRAGMDGQPPSASRSEHTEKGTPDLELHHSSVSNWTDCQVAYQFSPQGLVLDSTPSCSQANPQRMEIRNQISFCSKIFSTVLGVSSSILIGLITAIPLGKRREM